MRGPVKIIDRSNTDLKKSYLLRLELGIILSLSAFIFVSNMEITPVQDEEVKATVEQEIFKVEEIIQTKQEPRVPPPPRPMVPVAVPNDEILEDDIIEFDAELNLGESFDIPPPPPEQDNEDDFMEEEIFIVVEQQPELVGGLAEFQKTIRYPEMAVMAGIEGKVVLQFIVDKNGNVVDPVVLRGIL